MASPFCRVSRAYCAGLLCYRQPKQKVRDDSQRGVGQKIPLVVLGLYGRRIAIRDWAMRRAYHSGFFVRPPFSMHVVRTYVREHV